MDWLGYFLVIMLASIGWFPRPFGRFLYAIRQGYDEERNKETLRNILDWDRSRRATPLKAGMPPEKEARLLASET